MKWIALLLFIWNIILSWVLFDFYDKICTLAIVVVDSYGKLKKLGIFL